MSRAERIVWTLIFIGMGLAFACAVNAQDQNLVPDGDEEKSSWAAFGPSIPTACGDGTACNSTACDDYVDETPPSSPDNLYVATTTNANTLYFTFPTPSSNVSETTNAQAFDINVTKNNSSCTESSGGGTPTYTLELLCNGVDKGDVATTVSVSGIDQNDRHTFTYTVDGDCDAAGANVEIRFTTFQDGGGPNRRHASINTIEWEVAHAAAGPSPQLIMVVD